MIGAVKETRRYLLLTEEHIMTNTADIETVEEADDVNYSVEEDREED